jgi:divalent metal cation (Fe/Co/Zn/Cd) transporter
LSVLTGNGVYDGISSICIGLLLGAIAILLARETTSLLIGEAALPEQIDKIHAAVLATPGVDQVIHLRTVHLGPDDLLVAAKIGVPTEVDAEDVAATINAAEARIREALPIARIIYLEPDIYRDDTAQPASQLSPVANPDHPLDRP